MSDVDEIPRASVIFFHKNDQDHSVFFVRLRSILFTLTAATKLQTFLPTWHCHFIYAGQEVNFLR